MKAAIYARFSTDKQSDSSIEDQARNCTRYAERLGMEIVHRFEDKAISGTSKMRPGYQAMLAAAERGEFNALLVDDLSRLSRDDVEMKQVIRRFKFRRITIIGVSDGYDSGSKGEKIQSTMRGLMNELYLDDLREKTHRGLYGKAMNGFSAGGSCYGYSRVPIEHPTKLDPSGRPLIEAVRRVVNEEEAKWVRQIFEWYASGYSPKSIAAELNRKKIPSPRGSTWAANAIYGDITQDNGLLNNQLYIGRYIWNRSEWIKNPDSGKRKRIERPESEWVVTEMPDLRIVPQDMWDAVKARQAQTRQDSAKLRQALNNPKSRSHTGKYLFSGLLKCGCCGANFSMCSTSSYGCATNLNRGHAACSNKLRVPRRFLEGRLIEAIRGDLLSKEAVDAFIKETAILLRQAELDVQPQHKAMERQLVEAERSIANIMAAIKAGIITTSTKAELEKAEAARSEAEATLKAKASATKELPCLLPRAAERYRALVKDLGSTLQRDVAQARHHLKTLLGTINLVPQPEGHLVAELRHNREGIAHLTYGNDWKILLVAGAGFEPAAFRL
jgi:site-specific DNA recombinase